MYVIPAIDLVQGNCVRLLQGDYSRQINYNGDPVKQAEDFADAGAKWLHIVDLEGAKLGKSVNTNSISEIAKLGRMKIEVGGGIRNEQTINTLLDIGVDRVIIGTKAVQDFNWFIKMAQKYKGAIVLGLDAKGENIATDGWTKDSEKTILDFAVEAAKLPIAAIIYTDISKDGMLAGPNLVRTKQLAEAVNIPVIASGGVKELADIKNLKDLACIEAVIVGRSLYEGTLDLAEAIKAAGV